MKRVHIVHIISSLKVGGAEILLYTLLRHLDASLFKHTVIYFHNGPIKEQIEALGIETHAVCGILFRYDIFCFLRLIKLIKKIQPDIISSSLWAANFFSAFISTFMSVKLISILHAVRQHEGIIRNTLDYISLPQAAQIIAVSNTVAQSFKAGYIANLPINLTVITNGIDREKTEKIGLVTRASLNISDKAFVIGSVGRLVKVKNYELLLQASALFIKKYADTVLVIIGSGPEYKTLQNLADKLGIQDKVYIIESLEACKYYHMFNCFVQTSQFEGLSLALLEALSYRVPVIVAQKNNNHEVIIHNYNGLLVGQYDSTQVFLALEYLYLEFELAVKRAQNGFETISKNYNLPTMITAYTQMYLNFAER